MTPGSGAIALELILVMGEAGGVMVEPLDESESKLPDDEQDPRVPTGLIGVLETLVWQL